MTRWSWWVALLFLVGCHGSDVRFGTGHTFADGGSSGSVSGKHGAAGSWDVAEEDSTSVWVELGFQLSPQTVIVDHSDNHELRQLYPPPDFEPWRSDPLLTLPGVRPAAAMPAPPEEIAESRNIDWEEILVAVVTIISILFTGRVAVRRVGRWRAAKRGSR